MIQTDHASLSTKDKPGSEKNQSSNQEGFQGLLSFLIFIKMGSHYISLAGLELAACSLGWF